MPPVEKSPQEAIFLKKYFSRITLAGAIAGCVNGLFGAGGGMVLVPLLSTSRDLAQNEIFPSSVSIILPMCFVTLLITSFHALLPWSASVPYLIGSIIGGIISGFVGKKIPTIWLHRILGILILYGGFRYLC